VIIRTIAARSIVPIEVTKKGVRVMRLEDYPTEPRFTAKVLSTEEITEEGTDIEVRELILGLENHQFDFEIGQSIGVLVESSGDFGHTVHHRLYTVADTPKDCGNPEITIVVRRCNYIDDYSGEQFIGVNSNFLCDRKPGDEVTITGPFGMPFKVPEDKNANLLLIGLGTGIAPFRALVKHIYKNVGDWK
jgi:ferredoxin--NADP+ reductase